MIGDVMGKSLREGDPQGIRSQHERPMLAKSQIHCIDQAVCGSARCQNDLGRLIMATGEQGSSNMLPHARACLGKHAGFEAGLHVIDAETDFCG